MKSMRIAFAGVIAATLAVPAHAQERGWVELGAFGRYTAFDQDAGIDNGLGFGGRVGVFMDRRFMLEGEGSFTPDIQGARVPRTDEYNYTPLYLRLTANAPFAQNRHAFLVGAGVTRSNFGYTYNYGSNGLLGFKFGLGETVALRLDGLVDYLPNFNNGPNRDEGAFNTSLRAGLSFFRRPANLDAEREELRRRVAAYEATEAELTQLRSDRARMDSISTAYQQLQDSMSRMGAVSARNAQMDALAMSAAVPFDAGSATLDENGNRVLDAKADVMTGTNSTQRIRVVGHADSRGNTARNRQLAQQRAEAVRAYLVSRGIDSSRIEVTTDLGATGSGMRVRKDGGADTTQQQTAMAGGDVLEIHAGGECWHDVPGMMNQQQMRQQPPAQQPPAQQPPTQTPPAGQQPAPTPAPSPNPPTL